MNTGCFVVAASVSLLSLVLTAFLASDSSYAGSLHPGGVAGIAGIATNLLDQPAGAFRDSYHMPASRQTALGVGKLADPAFGSVRNAPVSAGSSHSATNATRIKNLRSQRQTLRLSCESRSASDWAAFFGVTIDELTFFDQLPKTDNPETGFVGDVNDPPGNLPPRGYGVHAKPVAALLQAYGLPAEAQGGMSVDMLESEIAAGRPVIVWTTGFRRSKPVVLTDSSGTTYVAARFEHTLIVVGYNRTSFYVADPLSGATYPVTRARFLESWAVLGNQAIIANVETGVYSGRRWTAQQPRRRDFHRNML